MTVFPRFLPVLAGVVTLGLAGTACADQSDRIVFAVTLKGLAAGELSIDGKITGSSYAAKGVMRTTGLAGMLKKIRYDAVASGSYAGGKFTPRSVEISGQRGDDHSKSTMIYKNGTPVSVSHEPPREFRPSDVAPAKQGGTIDPLTALYAVLRDVDRAEACKLKVTMFDGVRRSQVALSAPQAAGNGVKCAGEYRRLAGFKDKEMAEKTSFPFSLTYAPTPDGKRLQVVDIATDTIVGRGRLTRR